MCKTILFDVHKHVYYYHYYSYSYYTLPRMLPRVVEGDQKEHHGITYSVRYFLNTAYLIPATRGRTGGVVFRTDVRVSGCWRTAREGGAESRRGEWVAF